MYWRQSVFRVHEMFAVIKHFPARKFSTSIVMRKDHYDVLGVNKDATQQEIKNAYFALSKVYHPDRIDPTDENLAKFRAVSDAYEILGNEQSRKLYDRGLLKDSGNLESQSWDDVSDPIIRFYKERQQRDRMETGIEKWSYEYFKKVREVQFEMNEYYKYTAKKLLHRDNLPSELFVICAFFIASAVLQVHCENSVVHKTYQDILSFIDSKV